MKIYGLQKMTLLDFPQHIACTVFLGGCDFRCPFCHNYQLAEGKAEPLMTEDELLDFLKTRKGLLDGVAFTGGEPLLHKDLPALLIKIRDLGFATKVDTNGNHPELLRTIIKEGLVDYIAMDIKNSPEKYPLTCGVDSLNMDPILESIDILKTLGSSNGVEYEFRTTMVDELHQAEDFHKIGKLIEGAPRYFIQAFTDRDQVPYGGLNPPSSEKLISALEIASKYVPNAELRGVE